MNHQWYVLHYRRLIVDRVEIAKHMASDQTLSHLNKQTIAAQINQKQQKSPTGSIHLASAETHIMYIENNLYSLEPCLTPCNNTSILSSSFISQIVKCKNFNL